MRSRGIVYDMGAGTRKGLALSWTALFLCSLLLQYASLVAPARVLGVHLDGLFELDGNVESQAAPGDDWNAVHAGSDGAFETLFVTDPINGDNDGFFLGGDSKDIADISTWQWTTNGQPQDKNDIAHAYAAAYRQNGELLVYFGLDRYASDGDAQAGFWFLRNEFDIAGGPRTGTFVGRHAVGDVLVQIDFENGGTNPVLRVYKWVGSGGDVSGTLELIDSGASCDVAGEGDLRCGIAATGPTNPAWPYDDKSVAGPDDDIPAGGMVEGGINLTLEGLDNGCFASFVAETRSSQEPTATLSDFSHGEFDLCETPAIETQVRQDGNSLGSVGTINMGETVTDLAVLSGSVGAVGGTVDFFLCGPDAGGVPDCSNGGTRVGDGKAISDGRAESDPVTPDQTGYYCFRAEYVPAAGSRYFADSHTNGTTECFRVIPAKIDLAKAADDASVSAGDPIGFTLTVTSTGPGTAYGVKVTDPLPTNPGLDWSIDTANTTGTWSIADGVLSFGGVTGVAMAAGRSYQVHVTSPTTADTCGGSVDNTGEATTTNDGAATASASVAVLCASIDVEKVADDASVSAGDPIGFTITVTSNGPGEAKGVVLSDVLPTDAGTAWTIDGGTAAGVCEIVAGEIACALGDMAAGASYTLHLSSPTDRDTVADSPVRNTAAVTTTNDGSDTDTDEVEVLGPDLHVVKSGNGPLSAGDRAEFTITVTNDGPGIARDVEIDDALPPGIDWDVDSAACSITGEVGHEVLHCELWWLDPGASASVTVSGETTADNCGTIPNTATVEASNEAPADATDNDGAGSIVVNCAAIEITKTADDTEVSATDRIGFTITVTNGGLGIARDVTVTDVMEPVAGVAWQIDPVNSDPGWSLDEDGLPAYGPADLAAGASVSVHIVSATTPASCGPVHNVVTVTTRNDDTATDWSDIEVLCPDVRIIKSAGASPILAGQAASYTILVWNAGDGIARNVTLTDDDLAPGLAWTEDSDACEIESGVLTCEFGDLEPGAQAGVTVSAPTTVEDCGELPNTATVAADNEAPADAGDNEAQATVVVQCAAIRLVKIAGTAPDDTELVTSPGLVRFSYLVTNWGTSALQGIVLVDDNATPEDPSDDVTVTCPATLAAGTSMVCEAFLPVDFGVRTNVAVVTANPVLAPGTEVSADDDAVVRVPQLVIDKSVTGYTNGETADGKQALEGDILTYTLAYTLTDGPVTDGIIWDVLPEGLVYLDLTATDSDEFTFFGYDELTRTLTWKAPTVTASGTVTYQVATEDGAAALEQPLENTASIRSVETEVDADTEQIHVSRPELEITPTPRITPPPTSTADQAPESGAGNGLMLLLVALGGLTLMAGLLVPSPVRARNRRDRRR